MRVKTKNKVRTVLMVITAALLLMFPILCIATADGCAWGIVGMIIDAGLVAIISLLNMKVEGTK